jgi:hypothetical protein
MTSEEKKKTKQQQQKASFDLIFHKVLSCSLKSHLII